MPGSSKHKSSSSTGGSGGGKKPSQRTPLPTKPDPKKKKRHEDAESSTTQGRSGYQGTVTEQETPTSSYQRTYTSPHYSNYSSVHAHSRPTTSLESRREEDTYRQYRQQGTDASYAGGYSYATTGSTPDYPTSISQQPTYNTRYNSPAQEQLFVVTYPNADNASFPDATAPEQYRTYNRTGGEDQPGWSTGERLGEGGSSSSRRSGGGSSGGRRSGGGSSSGRHSGGGRSSRH
ncbi:hypothetical protein F5Y18DRAFT_151270 [Xylariaceae sp. FL1019]|nr:hypothetical protein F5Y18DRAFT_151270 [Xylariaceae sp. FL1019]